MRHILIALGSALWIVPLSMELSWSRTVPESGRVDVQSNFDCGTHAPGQAWQRTELFFGLSRPGSESINTEEFQRFLEQEVTPRFSSGFTVISAYGQYQNTAGKILIEDARVLVILYPSQPSRHDAIEAIRVAFKKQFEQESVLRVDTMACVEF